MLCFIICLSAVHSYMSQGIIRLAELPCWYPNILFSPLFLFQFQASPTNHFWSAFIYGALSKKPRSPCVPASCSAIHMGLSPVPTSKQTQQPCGSQQVTKSALTLPTGSLPDCLVHVFIVYLFILTRDFCWAHNVCQVGLKMLSLQWE